MKRKAIAYIQSDAESPTQLPEIQRYCDEHGIGELLVLVDSHRESGHLDFDQRPQGRKFMKLARERHVRDLISPTLHALFRDVADAGRHLQRWHKKRIRLHILHMYGLPKNQPFVTEGETGKGFIVAATALGMMARYNLGERIGTTAAQRKWRGFVTGETPYGYNRIGTRLAPNADEQNLIARMRSLRRERKTFREIAETLNAEGIRTKKGRSWHPTTVKRILEGHPPGVTPSRATFDRRS